jgi:hypothetical protein
MLCSGILIECIGAMVCKGDGCRDDEEDMCVWLGGWGVGGLVGALFLAESNAGPCKNPVLVVALEWK